MREDRVNERKKQKQQQQSYSFKSSKLEAVSYRAVLGWLPEYFTWTDWVPCSSGFGLSARKRGGDVKTMEEQGKESGKPNP